MLETVKKCIYKREKRTFEERYIDYIMLVQNKSVLLEIKYLTSHNKLDVLKLDKLINAGLQEAMEL